MIYKLEHFHSDWNRLPSEKPYHAKPSQQTIQQAITLGRVLVGNCYVFAKNGLLEVRTESANSCSTNIYRDMYRIIQ